MINESAAERFVSNYMFKARVGHDSSLVYSTSDRSAQIITSTAAVLLDCCGTFKTLEQHALECARVFAHGGRGTERPNLDSIRRHLSSLVEGGLLISETAILTACKRSEQRPPRIASVGVITHNRTASLERCLRSFIENSKKYGRTNDFVIMDDSEAQETRANNRAMLALLKREYDAEIWYAGSEEKDQYVKSLISEGKFDPDLTNFALTDSDDHGFACGKNRNALFLHTVGDLIFSTDDDAVCRIATPPVSEGKSEREPGGQYLTPTEFWFFAHREQALSFASFVEEDVLADHEQLLGRQLADCLASSGNLNALSLERPISHHLRSLQSGAGRVLVTLTGMIGDSGVRLPVSYKVLGRASRGRLTESLQTYLNGCSSREVLRVATRYCISNRTWFISTALGYDNRELLPPFFPVLRGTDGIFSDTLRRCHEYGYFGDVPRAILHLPPQARAYTREMIARSAATITMNSLIATCVLSKKFSTGVAEGAEKMRALGRHLLEIGGMSLEDFEEFALINLWRDRVSLMANLERELRDHQSPPDYWANDLKDYLTRMRASLTKPQYVVPEDLLRHRSLDEARHLNRSLVFKFGKLLCAWPDMVEAAKRLRAKGHGLAVPI